MTVPRIALYGHDTLGLGHLRRNLVLADCLAGLVERPDLLVVTGAPESGAFPLPPRTDLLRVPSVTKDGDGTYRSGRLTSGLDAVVGVRRAVLDAGLTAYRPDLLVVDKVALGFADELAPALHRLRVDGTRLVLGVRDVLDDPAVTRAEWAAAGTEDVVADLFDEVWVYGDPSVYDIAVACRWSERLVSKVRHTGYLVGRRDRAPAAAGVRPGPVPPGVPYVLCAVGGGADGAELARSFATTQLPPGLHGVLVTGSQMPIEDRRAIDRLAGDRTDLHVVRLTPDLADWILEARAVVAMGGYNTVSEILASSTPALIAPRTAPRAEQLIRCEVLARRGLVEHLRPHQLSPTVLASRIERAVTGPRVDRRAVDRGGLHRVRHLATALLHGCRPPQAGTEDRHVVAV